MAPRLLVAFVFSIAACSGAGADESDPWAAQRARMVVEQIRARGIRTQRVLDAMGRVPRHEFVPAAQRPHAYQDHALPIEEGQTISQPYIVALMTDLARLERRSRVLEVGTGSGYQAAVLAEVSGEVYSIEIVDALCRSAAARLSRLGYGTVQVRCGDGYRGWPERAPFDAILVTAAPPEIPRPLLDQLAVGGRLVAPVGESDRQELVVVRRTRDGWARRSVEPVAFVPMTGEAQSRTKRKGE